MILIETAGFKSLKTSLINAKLQIYSSYNVAFCTGYTTQVKNYTKFSIMIQTSACTIHNTTNAFFPCILALLTSHTLLDI